MITWTSSWARLIAAGTVAIDPATDEVESVLGGIEQDAARTAHREAAQAGDARGDGQIEDEKRFGAFWLAAEDSDGFFRPQPLGEPALLFGAVGETPGRLDRKQGHRRRRVATLVSLAAGVAQVSKNSVSSI